MSLIRFDASCDSLFMPILANSLYLRHYSCVANAGAAPGPEETEEGEEETDEVPPGLEEWAGNGPM